MSLESIETGEVVAHATEDEARRGTAKIKLARDRAANAIAEYADRVKDAYRRRFDLALGYSSWSEYASAELSEDDPLTADVRRELVGMLSADGMSPKAISPVAGVTRQQVSNIRAQVEQGANDLHPESPASPVTPPEPAATIGLDGKTYQRPAVDRQTGEVLDATPEPARPRRTPLPEQFFNAAYDLCRKAERVLQLTEDDRFTQNREKLALKHRNELLQVISDLQDVITALGEPAE
ncbi:Uncharacterised protein [Acidipropionibacterium jensenii]|uniref:Uncharacterized protein n=1 Tax=Acidipropionibacterium jensenii TaxID=1749 RepID=A0A3S4UZD3_9ACTN|nr:hypothetical protein [Acidipropionibacterium jensenii]VEI04149.1 Uncharacterised protein [Acidipropionibacterium jensenii]